MWVEPGIVMLSMISRYPKLFPASRSLQRIIVRPAELGLGEGEGGGENEGVCAGPSPDLFPNL